MAINANGIKRVNILLTLQGMKQTLEGAKERRQKLLGLGKVGTLARQSLKAARTEPGSAEDRELGLAAFEVQKLGTEMIGSGVSVIHVAHQARMEIEKLQREFEARLAQTRTSLEQAEAEIRDFPAKQAQAEDMVNGLRNQLAAAEAEVEKLQHQLARFDGSLSGKVRETFKTIGEWFAGLETANEDGADAARQVLAYVEKQIDTNTLAFGNNLLRKAGAARDLEGIMDAFTDILGSEVERQAPLANDAYTGFMAGLYPAFYESND